MRMPTFEEIAKLAGVSKATVSLALSDSPKISLATKTKVRNIAKNIGYNFNALDPGKWSRTRSIGALYISEDPDHDKEFFKETLMGISEDAAKADYDIVFIGVHYKNDEALNDEIADKVIRSGVEGIIVISSIANLKGFSKLIQLHFPMVFVGDRKVEGLEFVHNVCSDNYNGGRMAAEYLLGLGHTRISLVKLDHPPHWEIDRQNGFFSHLRNAGLTDVENNSITISRSVDHTDPSWRHLGEINPTAIFALSALVGLRVLQYVRSVGKQVPDDVSLIVFDDFSSFPYEDPPITVIKQDKGALGNLSVKILIDILENSKTPPKQMLISTQFIERSSCSAPKK